MKLLLLCCLGTGACLAAEDYVYWVQPCSTELSRESGCEAADAELAQWAIEAWKTAGGGRLRFRKTPQEQQARIRIYWAPANLKLYGEARPIVVNGKPGAAVYIRPDLTQLGARIDAVGRADRLFRHTIVYLTCLHETGHALGLPHSASFDDIMYSFGHGGDIQEYFARYRRKLSTRDDIRKHSGISPSDQNRLAAAGR